ncbi:tRNA glutamyl-Q(34) synthetase GluQRS [Cumulibacter soli]|uniref:tRNA glutamyl-Q(34) synthetase GluQRS n=1 Tax=Cumulibacter soli TaxID=2546344 RepID=UPI001067EE79|nr:tRNA glutamyl-Q(34) synthetase GluQRS [Cumulibacter soli]
MIGAGRFAPSPSGDLHIGNLRTAALAWLTARSSRRRFLLRIEDLDAQRSRASYADRQLADLHAIGIDWDGEVVRQSQRTSLYREALDVLVRGGHTFECYCSRKDIREAQSAPHADAARYPGTCRELSEGERADRRNSGRPPTIRLRSPRGEYAWEDLVLGPSASTPDDVVLARWDGEFAYNLAVVVDDLDQGVDQIVRGDDLADQTATQIHLIELLSGTTPEYAHVPLVLNRHGQRLSKRDGAVTLADCAVQGISRERVVAQILESLGSVGQRTLRESVADFALADLPTAPWIFVSPADC